MANKGREAVQEMGCFTDEQMSRLHLEMRRIVYAMGMNKQQMIDELMRMDDFNERQKIALAFLIGEFIGNRYPTKGM